MLLGLALGAMGGCTSKTETGYEPPHRLGMTEEELKGLYAPEFSKEAQAAGGDKTKNPNGIRPGQAGFGL